MGIVTVDDAIDVMTDETRGYFEDGGYASDKPYLKTSTFTLWKTRVPWRCFDVFCHIYGNNYREIRGGASNIASAYCLYLCLWIRAETLQTKRALL